LLEIGIGHVADLHGEGIDLKLLARHHGLSHRSIVELFTTRLPQRCGPTNTS
jgi:hypothetical protein